MLSTLFYICFAVTLLISTALISLVAFILYVTIRPFSRSLYRSIIWYFVAIIYGQIAFVAEWWARMYLEIYVDCEQFKNYFGKEHALIVLNHSYDIDWIPIIVLSGRLHAIGSLRSFVKKAIKYIPIFGWCFTLGEFILLERSFEKDKETITKSIADLSSYPYPLWLLLYPEGTWFTKKTHEESRKYAAIKKLPQLNYHLQPRTKGFITTVNSMRGKIPAVYDIEIAFDEGKAKPSLYNLLSGKHIRTYMYIKRIPVEEVPVNLEDQELFLRELFQRKDKLKESFHKTGDFFSMSGVHKEKCITLRRPLYLITIFVTCSLGIIGPLSYYTLSLLCTGNILWFSLIVGVAVTCLVVLKSAIRLTELK